eukprot:CAMPEP_0194290336 /NCGR_PEP_ID=MMETSP0169-20130528/41034_1 /TAXON_ID=218684 /ORGANISM="Corethron pennatum, Strain L29A3" /LENGTH=413 /DNA_ID=CAMNT_0039037891 /DNA_START=92 /DNA_END=1333 /DNA_ORIENTATION=-
MFPEKSLSALLISAVIGAVAVCGQSGRGASPRFRPPGSSTDGDHRELIWNGSPARAGRYPYMALLSVEGTICGGSLIAPNLVLSAAHCGESFTEVRVGAASRTINPDYFVEKTVAIEEVVVHPDYGGQAGDLENDFMILVLSSDINTITPVCLAKADEYIPGSSRLQIMGWGHTESSNNLYSDVLLEAEIFYVPNNNCREIVFPNNIRPLFDTIDSENYMCAASPKPQDKNSCLGDGGGPLLIKGEASDKDVQVGITSFGFQCEASVGVYARISAQRAWIDGVAAAQGRSLRQDCPTFFVSPAPSSAPTTSEPSAPPTIPVPTVSDTFSDLFSPPPTEPTASPTTPVPTATDTSWMGGDVLTVRSAAMARTVGGADTVDAVSAPSSGAGRATAGLTAVLTAVLLAAASAAGLL